ncbi:MAG: alkaline phosphatase PhoX, partial [Actinomycetota bacterium]
MPEELTRRAFLKVSAATAAALALGPAEWGWAQNGPFGPLQDDPLLRLPAGFSYRVIASTAQIMEGGRGPWPRPGVPDLNVVFPQPGGRLLLSTSHEVPAEVAVLQPPPPGEEYDSMGPGAVTSILLNPDLSIAETAFNAGGMVTNCSGSGTPWGTVLTGEEATTTLGDDHGFIWEVDVNAHTKTRLDDCGRFDHETGVVDPVTGYVYLTEDSGTDSLLYRLRPNNPGRLAEGGILEAFRLGEPWVTIDDPLGTTEEPAAQGLAKGATPFA